MPEKTSDLEELNRQIAQQKATIEKNQLERQLTKEIMIETNGTMPPWWSTTNAMTLSSAVLVFGFFVILIAAYLIKSGKSAESVLRIFGTILIVVSSLFLVVAGYSDKQIAPVLGLLGTIVGYLLGKEECKKKKEDTVASKKEKDTTER